MRTLPVDSASQSLVIPTPAESQTANLSTLEVKVQGAMVDTIKSENENQKNVLSSNTPAARNYNLVNFCSSETAMIVVNLIVGLAALLLYSAYNNK